MKKLLFSILTSLALLVPYAADAQLTTQQGGTGTTSPSGILYGDGTLHLKTVTIGSNLTFLAGTLSATGGSSFSYPFPASATSSLVAFNGGLTASTLSVGSLTGTLNAAGGVVYSTATSTISAGTGIGYSGTFGSEIGGVSGTITNTGVTSIVAGTNISISGATGAVTINASGSGGTNFWTSLGGNIYNNTGAQVQAPSFAATSTTATSTFAGDFAIGGSGGVVGTGVLPNPNLFIGTSTTHTPLYGRIPGDLIDSEFDWNGISSINVANANIGSCAASTYFADGNNPTLGGYYTTLSFLNDGWTDGGGAGCGIGASTLDKPEAAVLASPTGEMDFDISSTSQKGFADYHWNVNNINKMTLTNAGNLGIGSSSPNTPLSVFTNNFDPTTGHDYLADFNVGVGGASDPSIQFSEITSAPATYNTMDVSDGIWNFYDATSTSEDTLNTTDLLTFSNTAARFKATGATAFSVQPTGNTNNSFLINNSVANSATGLSITTAATGGTTVLAAIDSGANSSINLSGKGTGSAIITSGTSNQTLTNTQNNLTVGGGSKITVTTAATTFAQAGNGTAANTTYVFGGVANTNLTASAEKIQFLLNFGQNSSHAAGAITIERETRLIPSIEQFTAGTAAASATIASSSSFEIDAPPGTGANANLTNVYDLFLNATTSSASTTNSYGLATLAGTGALNNYAAEFLNGNVGIGTSSPIAALTTVAASTTAGTANDGYRGTISIIAGFENTTVKLFQVIDQWGHRITGGDTPTVTGGTSSVAGNDNNGTVTVTGTLLTSVTLNFAHAWTAAPDCTESDNSTALTADISSISTTQIVFGFSAGVNSGTVWYQCVSHQ